jgi:hypothetical protein
MAISRNNPLTKGASGMIGKTVVFRSWNGKTYMYNRPSKPTKESPQQKENRTKFSRAVAFSRKMMADPEKKAEYKAIAKELQLPNAYTAAVTEYMRKPEILDLDASGYTGETNQQIKVTAVKKGFTVQEVKVMVVTESGELIEEGTAIKGFGTEWLFETKTNVNGSQKLELVAIATDRNNNKVKK